MSKERLKKVMEIQTTTYGTQDMDDFIYAQFEEIAKNSEENYHYHYEDGNTYITKGMHAETFPCVIAHTDTVHDIEKNFTIFDDNDVMFAMNMISGLQVGVGGDDKVGIYVALEMLREMDVIKVAFFRDEEHGCLGSQEADMKWFNDVEFVFQCDRHKYKDFVNTIFGNKLFDKPFSKAIAKTLKKYGKVETDNGGLTDVYQLVENGLDVCVANMSCGYHRPHSSDEVLVLSEVFDTCDMVHELIKELEGKKWINTLYRPYVPYKATFPKKKKGATNWHERSKEPWSEVAARYEVPVHKPLRTYDDFDESEAYDHMDLEFECSKCESDEIMYDRSADADWCFGCDSYTNFYSHKPLDHDHRPTDDELHYQNSKEI